MAPDRLTYSALGAADNLVETGFVLIYGFTNKKADTLIPLARSWNHAPALEQSKGCASSGYEKNQRAYILEAKDTKLSFSIAASERSPIVNPCFVVKNWDSSDKVVVSIDGKSISCDKDLRQGIIRDNDGKQMLIIWLKTESKQPMEISISK